MKSPVHSLIAACLLAPLAGAQGTCPEEPVVANHVGAGTVACPCFVAGEIAGAVFDVPPSHYPIEILRVGIGWGSFQGGSPQALEQSINIYANGLPNPGAPIFQLAGPVLNDGFINEFDLEPIPGSIVLDSGPFTVGMELANDSQIFDASFVHDGTGCQPGKNVVFAIPGGWSDACTLGITGNWVFQIVYRRTSCGTGGTYCVTSANSVGSGVQIGSVGSTSISAADLTLTATGGPSGQFGLFYYGPNAIQAPFGNGFRCVGGGATGISRFAPQPIDVFGNASRAVNYGAPPAGSGSGQILPGSTWKFQFWYRDPAGGGAGFNLSNGLSLAFTS